MIAGESSAPTLSSLLRPIAVLPSSAKLVPRCMLEILGEHDTPDEPGLLGFRKGIHAQSC